MWNIINQGDYNIFSNKKIALRIKVIKKEKCAEIYVDYKGYNTAFIMEVWGLGDECKEWEINEKMYGDPVKNPTGIFFVVDLENVRAFIDLIYFFLIENNDEKMLKEEYKIN